MATDLTIMLEDRPGELAKAGKALGDAGVNIEGLSGVTVAGEGEVHVLVEDAAAARKALGGAGIRVKAENDVLILDVEDKPGTLGEVAGKLGDAGVNLNLAYLATNTRLVLGADDLAAARSVLDE
ncbi:MAG: ACT domain-containing protein [Anaerolineales bacterium]|jgi:hypothetical protein